MKRYDPQVVEPKWQKKWADSEIYKASEDPSKPKRYVLEYFPYPSGAAMHVGHVRNYTIGDSLARFYRMNGYNVLYPMGWDAFGLPAENYAIKHNISPKQAIKENTTKFKQQLTQMGFSYDWSREIDSSDPGYYKWTQWFFKLLFDRGLAYQKESLQWWCETDKTVLANEQVEAGKCWRCGNEVTKKPLKQWFFKITDYADRLVEDLEDLDWTDSIKAMQKNWIGKSKGAEIDFKVDGSEDKIRVFTTRPDTLFGATFMVLAPEHPLVQEITSDEQKTEVEKYVKATQAKSDVERQETDREKSGVFTGAYAINPANDEKIPIWIADYVLYGYGTGAIMAVPAHDERDFEFAKKFDIPIQQVIAQLSVDKERPLVDGKPVIRRRAVHAVVKHPTEDKILMLYWDMQKGYTHVIGGIEEGESPEEAGRREVLEETGYKNLKFIGNLGDEVHAQFFAMHKDENRYAEFVGVAFELEDEEKEAIETEELNKHKPEWIDYSKALDNPVGEQVGIFFERFRNGLQAYGGEGVLVNSGKYNDMSSSEARDKIVADLAKQGVAEEKVNYKIRDWLISRQRYWGAPIPIIHCEDDGAVPVPEDQLPVELPEVKDYQPTGKGSALASATEWVNTTCPKCGKPAKRETDTMDGFACSSWYFLRFADPHNQKQAFSKEKADFWLPVDDYIGGAEHAVMHLLYARMWTKVMYDASLINFNEPFKALRNHGMILAPDGRKMSKSWGNVIAPDDLIDQGYGADSVRLMELFIGPWNQEAAWSVEGMGGVFRFLQRVWTLTQEYLSSEQEETAKEYKTDELVKVTHQTIKKVTEDLQDMGFNTAIASLMEMTNMLYKLKKEVPFKDEAWSDALNKLTLLLAPFAPHMAEELWQELRHEDSVHTQEWPEWNEKYLISETINIVVQVNGKVRANIEMPADSSEEAVIEAAKENEKVAAVVGDNSVKKSIYVPKKLVNLVV